VLAADDDLCGKDCEIADTVVIQQQILSVDLPVQGIDEVTALNRAAKTA
jgi:hypothetical protein